MNCSACGCPGGYKLLRGLLCWNRQCRNWHSDIIEGSDFSQSGLVNGDSVDEVNKFLDLGDGEDFKDFPQKGDEVKERIL